MNRKTLLCVLMHLLLGATLWGQADFSVTGVLTTRPHPSDPNAGPVLAVMTMTAYHPLELQKGVYIPATQPLSEPQNIAGNKILLDSIYTIRGTWQEKSQSYTYDWEQLYKRGTYVSMEGWFVSRKMGVDPGTGTAMPGIEMFFLTKDRKEIGITDFLRDSSGYTGSLFDVLGGWLKRTNHMYYVDRENNSFETPPDSIYTIKFLELSNETEGGIPDYIPTHLLSNQPMATAPMVSLHEVPTLHQEAGKIMIQSPRPMTQVSIYSVEGYTLRYRIATPHELTLPLPANRCAIILTIDFEDGSPSFSKKIVAL